MDSILKSIFTCTFLALATSTVQAEPNAEAVADRLLEAVASGGAKVEYGQAIYNPSDDTISIIDIQIENVGDVGKIAMLRIKGYDESNTVGLTADQVIVNGIQIDSDGSSMFVTSVDVTAPFIETFSLDPDAMKDARSRYESFAVENVNFVPADGKPPVSVATISSTADLADDGSISGDATLSIDDLNVPAALFEDEAKLFMDASGYGQLLVDLNFDGGYNASTQLFDIRDLTIDAAEMGIIKFSASAGGIIADLLQDPEQMQGLMATATILNASLSFQNNSIFEKGLEFASNVTGQSVDQLKQQAPFIVGLGLAQIGDQNFTNMVTSAVGSFLESPQSISVSASPSNPVPVAQIAGAAMTAPQTIPGLLSVSVSANQ